VILDQRADLGRDLRAFPAHHEALSHGPDTQSVSQSTQLSLPRALFLKTLNKTKHLFGSITTDNQPSPSGSKRGKKREQAYQSRSSHCGSRASSEAGSILTGSCVAVVPDCV
jgi:hypothetical protein